MTWLEPATATAEWELYRSLVNQEAAASRLRVLTTWLLKGVTQIAALSAWVSRKSIVEQVEIRIWNCRENRI